MQDFGARLNGHFFDIEIQKPGSFKRTTSRTAHCFARAHIDKFGIPADITDHQSSSLLSPRQNGIRLSEILFDQGIIACDIIFHPAVGKNPLFKRLTIFLALLWLAHPGDDFFSP